jgi:hypothetical protein
LSYSQDPSGLRNLLVRSFPKNESTQGERGAVGGQDKAEFVQVIYIYIYMNMYIHTYMYIVCMDMAVVYESTQGERGVVGGQDRAEFVRVTHTHTHIYIYI